MENKKIKNKILEKIFLAREEKIDDILKSSVKEINKKLINTNKNEILKKYNDKELFNLIENIEENYNIKISYLNEKMYEQGFIDGVNLIIECLNK